MTSLSSSSILPNYLIRIALFILTLCKVRVYYFNFPYSITQEGMEVLQLSRSIVITYCVNPAKVKLKKPVNSQILIKLTKALPFQVKLLKYCNRVMEDKQVFLIVISFLDSQPFQVYIFDCDKSIDQQPLPNSCTNFEYVFFNNFQLKTCRPEIDLARRFIIRKQKILFNKLKGLPCLFAQDRQKYLINGLLRLLLGWLVTKGGIVVAAAGFEYPDLPVD